MSAALAPAAPLVATAAGVHGVAALALVVGFGLGAALMALALRRGRA